METKCVDSKGGRYYLIGDSDVKYISVTTPLGILSVPHLEVWRAKIGNKAADFISAKAASHGSTVHSWAERLCKGESVDKLKEKDISIYKALQGWIETRIKKTVLTETVVWDEDILVAGRLDWLGQVKGLDGLTIIDWKTGRIKKEHYLQLAVYRHLVAKSQGIPLKDIKHRLVVGIKEGVKEYPPDPKNPAQDNNMEVDWEVYKALLQVYHYFRKD